MHSSLTLSSTQTIPYRLITLILAVRGYACAAPVGQAVPDVNPLIDLLILDKCNSGSERDMRALDAQPSGFVDRQFFMCPMQRLMSCEGVGMSRLSQCASLELSVIGV